MLEDRAALLLKLIVQTAEGVIDTFLCDWKHGAVSERGVMFHTAPICVFSLLFPTKDRSTVPTYQFSGKRVGIFPPFFAKGFFSKLDELLYLLEGFLGNNGGMCSHGIVFFAFSFVLVAGWGKDVGGITFLLQGVTDVSFVGQYIVNCTFSPGFVLVGRDTFLV